MSDHSPLSWLLVHGCRIVFFRVKPCCLGKRHYLEHSEDFLMSGGCFDTLNLMRNMTLKRNMTEIFRCLGRLKTNKNP